MPRPTLAELRATLAEAQAQIAHWRRLAFEAQEDQAAAERALLLHGLPIPRWTKAKTNG
jgi:hypothetical protein